jgi:predicted DNA-binding ribbon-helix-helix protein
MKSPIVRHTIRLGDHRTSVTLEDAFWRSLKEIARRHQMTVSELVGFIDSQRQHNNLSSALRLFVLKFYRSQIPDREDREGVPG